MSSDKCDSSQSSSGLNESWVELSMSGAVNKTSGQSTPSLERLLVDAQKESGLTSRNSSGPNSSKALNSPPLSAVSGSSEEFTRPAIDIPQDQLTEFIRDWSSRPEINPPSDYKKLSRPVKKHPLSVRNTRVMKEGWFNTDNIPALVITHAASFVAGASLHEMSRTLDKHHLAYMIHIISEMAEEVGRSKVPSIIDIIQIH